MAGHARFTAVLDACVLFPIATADALISLAVAGLFSAKWTVAIEAEWLAVAERRHPELPGRFVPRRDAMRDAVLDWEFRAGRLRRPPSPFPTQMTFTCWRLRLLAMPTAS